MVMMFSGVNAYARERKNNDYDDKPDHTNLIFPRSNRTAGDYPQLTNRWGSSAAAWGLIH